MPGQRRLNSRRRFDQGIDRQSPTDHRGCRWRAAAALALLLVLLPVYGALADQLAAPGVASPLVEDAPVPAGEAAHLPGDRLQVFQFADRLNARLREWGQGATGQEPYDRLLLLVPARTLIAYRDGRPVRAYPAAVGRSTDPTPTGSFQIINRVVDPTWYPRGAEPVPPGPDNPIGSRWLGLDLPGYGIHGTNNPDSIGLPVSLGCIRLLPGHVEELFDRTMIGTPVDIVYQRLWLAPSPDGLEVLVGVFPDPYHQEEVAVADVFARLTAYRPAGVPGDAAAAWLAAGDAGPALFVVGPERAAVTTLNGRPLPGVEPVMVDADPWLPVEPLATYIGARVQGDSPPGELWVDGRPVPARMVAGRRVAPARLLAQRLGLSMTALVDADEILMVELSGLGVFWWGGPPSGPGGHPGPQESQEAQGGRRLFRRQRPILVTRRAMHLAGGRLAVPAADLQPWLGDQLAVGPGTALPLGGPNPSYSGGPFRVTYRGRPVAWVTGPGPTAGEPKVYLLLDSLAAAGAFTVTAHPFYPMVILQGRGSP
ncbi:MAG TPA: L,D-transpeptidase [Sphingobacteriaceae bacterium]|nr:L,D-transpeptidase [Sphingobacteriaceae bacterium]